VSSLAALSLMPAAIAISAPDPTTPSDILAGPKVSEGPERPSLVKVDFAGQLERLDTRPEAAAISLLNLSAEERAKVDRFFTERTASVTAALYENMDAFLELQAVRQSGDLAEARPQLRRFRQSVAPLLNPPLAEQVAAHLPESARDEFSRLVNEYKQALQEADTADRDRAINSPESDRMSQRRQRARVGSMADARYELSQLMREMARSLSTIVDERRAQTEQLLVAIDATPEQRGQITTILRESAEQTSDSDRNDRRTPERAEAMTRIFALLTPDQRRKLREYLRQP
jgi:hypothetical protein